MVSGTPTRVNTISAGTSGFPLWMDASRHGLVSLPYAEPGTSYINLYQGSSNAKILNAFDNYSEYGSGDTGQDQQAVGFLSDVSNDVMVVMDEPSAGTYAVQVYKLGANSATLAASQTLPFEAAVMTTQSQKLHSMRAPNGTLAPQGLRRGQRVR